MNYSEQFSQSIVNGDAEEHACTKVIQAMVNDCGLQGAPDWEHTELILKQLDALWLAFVDANGYPHKDRLERFFCIFAPQWYATVRPHFQFTYRLTDDECTALILKSQEGNW